MSYTNRDNGERKRIVLRIRISKPNFTVISKALLAWPIQIVRRLLDAKLRYRFVAAVVVLLLAEAYSVLTPYFQERSYALGSSSELLPEINSEMSAKIKFDTAAQLFNFNKDPQSDPESVGANSLASASAPKDPTKGVTVSDPTNKVDFTMIPKFGLAAGRQDGNRIVYPLSDGTGWAVYTMQGVGVKEDIILNQSNGDTASYKYTLKLGDAMKAKLQDDGSIGIFGNTLLSGNVSTGSAKDAELLEKARKNGAKNTLLFSIPAPVVVDKHGPANSITSKYTMDGDELTVTVTGLKKGNYPISIDPSIYVVTAQQFMAGNNETNINFDVDNKLIKKGRTTGARFDSWSSTTSLPTANWGGSTVVAGGYIYSIGGSASNNTVNWTKLDTGNGTLTNADPGSGSCTNWCTSSAYNLPDGRTQFSLTAYNGYLYAVGGISSNCTSGNGTGTSTYCKTVYVAKLGANGEPRLWHPTDTNTANWTYWYRDTDLPAERAFAGAVAYNNRMYFVGGLSASATTNTVYIADITGNGKLGTWASSGNTLPAANQHGIDVQVYNDRLYVIGGVNSSYAVSNTVYYTKINSDGTINSWIQTSSFSTGRFTYGGNMTVMWGGYMYLSGGCSAYNGSGWCTTVQSDTQVASINADGSLDTWTTVSGVSDTRFAHSMVAWRDYIYEIGGCSAQNLTTGDCSTTLSSVKYGKVNQDGDISTVSQSVASATAPCSGTNPTNCNTTASNSLASVMINGGNLYVIGGCTNVGCTTTSRDSAFTGIAPTGDLVRATSCPAGAPASNGWCVQTNALPTNGRAGMSITVLFGIAFVVGGFTGSAVSNTVDRFVIGTDGTLTPTAQSLTSVGAIAVSYAYAYARANPASNTTNPGNLYIFGGCTTSGSGPNCSAFTQNVYKCNITSAGAVASCATTSQLQIGTPTGASGNGLAIASGTVYANYIYLIGGSAPGLSESSRVRYAKFDNSNNVVTTGTGWVESSQTLPTSIRYASSFAYNGYLYVVGGYNTSAGIQNAVRFIKINTTDGSLDTGGWKASTVTITGAWGLSTGANNGYLYIVGGCTTGAAPTSCSAMTSTVQKIKIYNNNNGGVAGWSSSANQYSTARLYQGSTILNGYIYVAGGCSVFGSSSCDTATTSVQYAAINAGTGAVGAWTNTTAQLATATGGAKLLTVGGSLYFVGGVTSNFASTLSTVLYATPSGTGDVSSWTTATNGLPQTRAFAGGAVWNNRMYIVGGNGAGCTSNICDTIYISPQLNSGGDITSSWTSATNKFAISRQSPAAVAYGNNLYVFGGITPGGGVALADSQVTQINSSTGDLGTWSYSTSMPQGSYGFDAFAANGYVYLVGGNRNITACASTSYVAPISANTSIVSGSNPTGVGNWFETNAVSSGARYGNSVNYSDGKAYLLGGYCPSALASPNVQQTSILSQPQVAKYSIAFDTDTDVFPTNWLLNGVDNSIGAKWQLKYRSMTNPGAATQCAASGSMSTWGQETTFTNVALGLPGLYTAKDSTGVNTSCARYYYMNVSVDSSQAFGYPDDVTRGPTISDLTLRMTADPAKRLMHGRTFTGGLQMPIDTPYNTN